MKFNRVPTALAPIIFVMLLSLAPAYAKSCSLSGVAGAYGYTIVGTIPALGAAAAVGHVRLTALGNLTGAQSTSFNGTIVPETLSGTFTVKPNCTGAATINVSESGVVVRTDQLDVVFVNNQRGFRAIFLSAGTVLTVNGTRTLDEEEDH